jgi:hypothetical protein
MCRICLSGQYNWHFIQYHQYRVMDIQNRSITRSASTSSESRITSMSQPGKQNGGAQGGTQAQPRILVLLPDEHKCGTCGEICTEDELSVECEICEYWHHISCKGISQETLDVLGANQQTLHWYCSKCNVGWKKIFNYVARIQRRQDETDTILHTMGTRMYEMNDTISANAKSISELKITPKKWRRTQGD